MLLRCFPYAVFYRVLSDGLQITAFARRRRRPGYLNIKTQYFVFYISKQDGGFTVVFPNFPEAITEVDSEEEAQQKAREYLSLASAMRIRKNGLYHHHQMTNSVNFLRAAL